MKKYAFPLAVAFALVFASMASAAATLNLPLSPVGAQYGPWGGGASSIFDVTLTDVGVGFDISDGTYPGWCIQRGVIPAADQVTLYSSNDPNMPADVLGLPWDKINYLLNHKAGDSADVQDALSVLLNQRDPSEVSPAAAAMAQDADTNGSGFVPGPGQIIAALLYSDGYFTENDTYQEMIIELQLPERQSPGTGTPGYWKNHPEAWPVSSITIGEDTYSKDKAIQIMGMPDGDKSYTLFRAYVSAYLNGLIGNDTSCVATTMTSAYDWLNVHEPGSNVRASSNAWKIGEPLYTTLDNYNNGLLCAPHRD